MCIYIYAYVCVWVSTELLYTFTYVHIYTHPCIYVYLYISVCAMPIWRSRRRAQVHRSQAADGVLPRGAIGLSGLSGTIGNSQGEKTLLTVVGSWVAILNWRIKNILNLKHSWQFSDVLDCPWGAQHVNLPTCRLGMFRIPQQRNDWLSAQSTIGPMWLGRSGRDPAKHSPFCALFVARWVAIVFDSSFGSSCLKDRELGYRRGTLAPLLPI